MKLIRRLCLAIFIATLTIAWGLGPQPSFARKVDLDGPTTDRPITHGNPHPAQPRVALSFDACQTARHTTGFDQAILDVLTRTQTPATVFLGGLWMQSHISATQALAANPLFELGNHSWSHLDFGRINSATMQAEIIKTQDKMMDLVGRKPTLFRFPYGHFTTAAVQLVKDNGLAPVQWDVVSGDPSRGNTAKRILNKITKQAHDGAIIVMHINGRGWHTAEALPQIITALKAQGYTFVTVSELLQP